MWVELTAEQAYRLYRVSLEVAWDATYQFYESSFQSRLRSDYDGPWSLVAVQADPRTPTVVTLQIANIEFEQLEWEGFDPLRYPGNFLLLHKPAALSLADLLRDHARRLQESEHIGPAFTRLNEDELKAYRLEGEVFPNHTQSFYLQAYSPTRSAESGDVVAIVFFSSIDPQPADLLFIGIREYSRELLNASEGDPAAQSLARIVLNKHGLEELAALIEAESRHLADRQQSA